MKTIPGTILLQVNSRYEERPEHELNVAATKSITPGMLIEFASATTVQPCTKDHTSAQPMFALEPKFTGADVATAAIDTPWTPENDPCVFIYAQPGDLIYALLADEANVARGAPLMCDGAGALEGGTIDATVVEGAIVAWADEAVNNTGGSGPVRIRVRVA